MWKRIMSICDTGYNYRLGEGQGTIALGSEENQHAYFQGCQRDWGPTGSLKWHGWRVRSHETRHFRVVLARDKRGLLKVGKEPIGSRA